MSGNAVPNVGKIHASEVKPTLEKLSHDMGLAFNLSDYVVGSAGKKEYSGDVDVVLDTSLYNFEFGKLYKDLVSLFGKENVVRYSTMMHLRYPIVTDSTRYVQIDFIIGDYKWLSFYYNSPGASSQYKGAHRNLAISAICTVADVMNSSILDGYDRPMEQIRWKWGPAGFIRVKRLSLKGHDGVWMKRQEDTIIEGPYYTDEKVRNTLFPINTLEEDLYSLETIVAAVKRNYSELDQERIWRRMASNFADWQEGKKFNYSDEIERYFDRKDK